MTLDGYCPGVLITMYFLWKQCFLVNLLRIAQDNEAAQLLETRGRLPSTSMMEHINRSFSCKRPSQLKYEEEALFDCPIEKMWTDYFTNHYVDHCPRRERAQWSWTVLTTALIFWILQQRAESQLKIRVSSKRYTRHKNPSKKFNRRTASPRSLHDLTLSCECVVWV